jgi:hypothetical protein
MFCRCPDAAGCCVRALKRCVLCEISDACNLLLLPPPDCNTSINPSSLLSVAESRLLVRTAKVCTEKKDYTS